MQKLRSLALGASACAALFLGSASASADGYVRGGVNNLAPARCANFNGFYVGAHGGWTYYSNEWKDLDNYGFNFTFQDHIGDGSLTANSWHGGVQGGYNLQRGCTLFGVQADWSWTNAEANASYTDFPTPPAGTLAVESRIKSYGTVRARTGLVVDNLLLYLTGGVAFADFDRDFIYVAPTPGATGRTQIYSSDGTSVGFVAGAGTEWNIGGGWSLASEFLYMGFDKDKHTYTCSTPGGFGVGTCLTAAAAGTHPFRYEFSDTMWSTRLGLNFRW